MEAPLLPGFKLKPTFFGFNAKDKITLHENIFNLIWFGEGRWDWNTIYNMPVHIRALWTRKVNQIIAMRDAPTESSPTTPKNSKLAKLSKPSKSA